MLSASRMLVGYLNGGRANDEALMTALLGEGLTTLQTIREQRGEGVGPRLVDAEALEAALEQMRKPVRASPALTPATPAPRVSPAAGAEADLPVPQTLRGLDAEIVRRARALGQPHVRIGRLFARLTSARAWRVLGYESAARYALERVGMSLSAIERRVQSGSCSGPTFKAEL